MHNQHTMSLDASGSSFLCFIVLHLVFTANSEEIANSTAVTNATTIDTNVITSSTTPTSVSTTSTLTVIGNITTTNFLTTLNPTTGGWGNVTVGNSTTLMTTTSPTTAAAATTLTITSSTTMQPRVLDCEAELMHVDGCIKRIVLIGDKEAIIPMDVKEFEEKHCNRIKDELICVREYGKVCLKLFPRTIFAIVRKNVEKVFKSFCATDEGKRTAVMHLRCFKPSNLIVLHSVVDKITQSLEFIEKNVTDTQIIPYMCCAFFTFYHETKIIVDNMCMNSTGPGTSEFIINIIKAVVTDALDLGCGPYGSYKKCNDNLADGVHIFSQIFSPHMYPNSTFTSPNYSPVVPMIGISKRLDSDL